MEQKMNTNMNNGMMMDAAAGASKTGKGMMVGMIACAILAVGGIGFGVYEMTQANSAKQQISDLKVEIKNQDGTTTTLETDKIEVKDDTKTVIISDDSAPLKNPVIENGTVTFQSSEHFYDGEKTIAIDSASGNVSCYWFVRTKNQFGVLERNNAGDCQITGLEGRVSSIFEIGNSQMDWPYLGFLMEDGTVKYASLFDAKETGHIAVKGNLMIDKFVQNIIPYVGVTTGNGGVGGYQTSVFVFSDGSTSGFSESMVSE